jgi:hypothetical protein
LTHSWRSSSQTFFSFFEWLMPLAFAKRSHFVRGLGLGSGFSRGSWKTGSGRIAMGPFSPRWVGRLKREPRSACVDVSVSARRCASRLLL